MKNEISSKDMSNGEEENGKTYQSLSKGREHISKQRRRWAKKVRRKTLVLFP